MLDQNTDRMWFVIGAVIVGAAIIFITNGTIPEIFASVTESFQGASNTAIAVMEDIGEPVTIEKTINIDSYWEQGGMRGSDAEMYHTPYKIRTKLLAIEPGTYSVVPKYDNDNLCKMVIHTFDSNHNHIGCVPGSHTPEAFSIGESGGYIQVEFAYFEMTDGVREMIEEDLFPSIVGESLTFDMQKLN